MNLSEHWREAGEQIIARAGLLAQLSDAPGMMTRTYLTPAHHAAAKQIAAWMREAGMIVRRDAVGNVIGRYEAVMPGAPALLTGSHFDTVRDGGRYDGILGILLPIACVAQWHREGRRFAHAIEVIGFAEEEGVRFKATLLGSRAVAGSFDPAVLESKDDSGITMRDAINASGLGYTVDHLPAAAYHPDQVLGFIEVHIEQGPVLLNENLPLGVVTAISGATRLTVELEGQSGHAGTVPMCLRRDAAMAGAEIGLFIEQHCRNATNAVGTVGQFSIPNGATNVVPGKAQFSIDIRAEGDAERHAIVDNVLRKIEEVAVRRQIRTLVHKTHEAATVPCSVRLRKQLEAALQQLGSPVRYLPSGAGHDAMALAALTDVAMLFVRCGNGGISHHPDETITAQDAAVAAHVFAQFVAHFHP